MEMELGAESHFNGQIFLSVAAVYLKHEVIEIDAVNRYCKLMPPSHVLY